VPELPEVETVVRTLRPQLIGRRIRHIQVGPQKLRQHWNRKWNSLLLGSSIQSLERRGKWILLQLSQPGCHLIIHLGMTGRLQVLPAAEEKTKHTHFVFSLDDAREELRFHDPRRFGSVVLAFADGNHRFPAEAQLGPEPFDLNATAFYHSIRQSKRNLKAILLDQSTVAGVGNIYADEALFQAKIPPRQLGTQLTLAQARRLRSAIVQVLNRAIAAKGSTIANFYYGNNQSGGYQNQFRVYDQTGKPCRRCRTPIQRIRLVGRSTHFCPQCQH
jgi:formamidopyrimidine-DNA glycosylase